MTTASYPNAESLLKDGLGMTFTEPAGNPATFEAKSDILTINDQRVGHRRKYGFTFNQSSGGNAPPTLREEDYLSVLNNLRTWANSGTLMIQTPNDSVWKNLSENDLTLDAMPA